MKEQLRRLDESGGMVAYEDDDGCEWYMPPLTELWSCRFNSGLFNVDWSRSRRVLEEAGLEVTVVRPPGEAL